MDDLRTEADVRAALHLLGQDAPNVADLLRPLASADRPRRRGRRFVPLAAALVVALVAVGVAALYLAQPARQSSRPGGAPSRLSLPAGIRLASYGPISVRVPVGLSTRTSLCGGPVSREVVAPDGVARLCPVVTDTLAAHPGTVVWFGSGRQDSPYARIPTSPSRMDGRPARRGYAIGRPGLGSGVSAVVVFPDQAITIGVTAPTRDQVDTVLSSIRVARRNALGCAAHVRAASTTPAGPGDVLVPGEPLSAVRCAYSPAASMHGLLIWSSDLGPSATTRLAAALDQLSPDPCHCLHGGSAAPGGMEVLYFDYRDGSALRIDGALGANLDTYSNNTRTVANYDGSIGWLLTRLSNRR